MKVGDSWLKVVGCVVVVKIDDGSDKGVRFGDETSICLVRFNDDVLLVRKGQRPDSIRSQAVSEVQGVDGDMEMGECQMRLEAGVPSQGVLPEE